MKNKYAGVTLDWYDDKGATLKTRFPTVESLPEIIKEADIRPMERLANEDFALVAIDEGNILRKFACHDPGTTAMSVIYFMEHGDKLPDGAQKMAAANLVEACLSFYLAPPDGLMKAAGVERLLAGHTPGLVDKAKALGQGFLSSPVAQSGMIGGGLGAGVGGIAGAVNAEEGSRLRGAGKGALTGGVAGGALGTLYGGAARLGETIGRRSGVGMAVDQPVFGPELKQRLRERIIKMEEADPTTAKLRKAFSIGTGVLGGATGGAIAASEPGEKSAGVTISPRLTASRASKMLGIGGGGALGAAGGALTAEPGDRGDAALIGGLLGAGAGYGGGALARRMLNPGAEAKLMALTKGMPRMSDLEARGVLSGPATRYLEQASRPIENRMQMASALGGGLAGAGAGAGTGAGLSALSKESSQMIDITGKRPTPKVKVASSSSPNDYAVVLPDGSRHYPIHTWDLVKKAEVYFQEEKGRMQPEIRRQYAVKLAARAASMGFPLDPEIFDAGSTRWASKGHLQAAVEMRKVACQPGEARDFLDELFEKRASLEPAVYAEVLRRFDVQQGLDRGWDQVVLDPWASTFGMNKTAEVVWEDGNDRVTSDQLVSLAQNHLKRLRQILTEGMCKEFLKDPVGIFESMPLPQKRIISRLASDHPENSEITQAVV